MAKEGKVLEQKTSILQPLLETPEEIERSCIFFPTSAPSVAHPSEHFMFFFSLFLILEKLSILQKSCCSRVGSFASPIFRLAREKDNLGMNQRSSRSGQSWGKTKANLKKGKLEKDKGKLDKVKDNDERHQKNYPKFLREAIQRVERGLSVAFW